MPVLNSTGISTFFPKMAENLKKNFFLQILAHLETLIVLVTTFFLVKKGQISKHKTGVVCGQHESILYSKVWNFASKTVTMLLCA